jgi:alpha-beta hydrolase superfamily lysophospholipase
MQTHFKIRTLKYNKNKDVRVIFATNPSRKAILFIHGYNGDAINTWSDFHELLPGRPKCAHSDIYFYGYDGLWAELQATAAIFRAFLDNLFNGTNTLFKENLTPSESRPIDFMYDELVIVAHSLGAVIARRALLDATQIGSDWISRIKLVLFAPAHKGARAVDLAMEALSWITPLKFCKIFISFNSPITEQLKPGSQTLKDLLEETNTATKNGGNPHLIAKKVVIAQYDKIVTNERFGNDPPPESIPDTTHTSVCKPKINFLQPISILEDQI